MRTDTLIVGQGLCGTWLSYWLQQAGADYLVLDEENSKSASKVASGIINPVTGRRMVKTWLADVLLPFATAAYNKFGNLLGSRLLETGDLLDFFSSPDRRLSFEKRALQFEAYLEWPQDENQWLSYFNYPFGFGIVSPVLRVAVQPMLVKWREQLDQSNRLIAGRYEPNFLDLSRGMVRYKDIEANRVVFCDGTAVMQHHFFHPLPFAINKGEALIVSIPGLPSDHLYKKTSVIAPWNDGLFWVGSNYDRDFKDEKPSSLFLHQTSSWLQQFVKRPFAIVDHVAALRPTTVERRPFAGMHPHQPLVGIFNGMGTKGVSLAPYIGHQLATHILKGDPLMPEVDVSQYSRILQRL